MVCERLGRKEENFHVWLRRERGRELEKDGKVDSILMGWEEEVEIWRGGEVAEKEGEMSWRGVNVTRDDEVLAGLEGCERHWQRTREAMERLGTAGRDLCRDPTKRIGC